MDRRAVGLVGSLFIVAATAAWWFAGRADVAPDGVGTDVAAEPPGALEGPARPGVALAGQGRPGTADAPPKRVVERPRPVPDGPTVQGVVVDGAGRGVAGARIVAIPDTATTFLDVEKVAAEGGTGAENFSDERGRFVVAAVGDAPVYGLVAQAEGFALALLDGVRVGADVRIVLGAGARLSGRVLTIEGEPVAGATVRVATTLDLVRTEETVVSGADGGYAVERLPTPSDRATTGAFRYTAVFVTKEGFASLMVPGFGRPVPGRPAEFALDLVLVRGAVLVGTVVDDETSRPIEGARVVLWTLEALMGASRPSGVSLTNPWSNRVVGETTSGADGTFRIDHVPATGFHRIESHNMGRRGLTLGYVSAGKPGLTWGSDEVPIVADGATIESTVRLRPAASIVGRVVTATGAPVAEAYVVAYREGLQGGSAIAPPDVAAAGGTSAGKTDVTGAYRLRTVPASSSGPTRLKVNAHAKGGYSSEPPTVEVDVVAGVEVRAPDLVTNDAAAAGPSSSELLVVLLVRDDRGEPIGGATSSTSGRGDYVPNQAMRSDRAGRLRVAVPRAPRSGGPPPTVTVRARGYAPAPVVFPRDVKPDAEVPVTLATAHRLTGRLLLADGTPATTGQVNVYNAAVPLADLLPKPGAPAWAPRAPKPNDPPLVGYGAAAVGEGGRFVVEDLPEGPYHLVASGGYEGARSTIPVPPATKERVATDATDVELVLPTSPKPAGGRILGRVVDAATGRPVGTISVNATRRRGADEPPPGPTTWRSEDGSSMYAMGPTGPTVTQTSPGSFEATGTEHGTYDLTVSAPGYVGATIDGVVVADADVEVATVTLSRGARVHGRFRLPDGEALRDRTLSLVAEGAAPGRVAGGVALSSSGTYEITGLVPGRYRALATAGGFTRPPVPALLRAGDEPIVVPEGANHVEVELALVPAGTLTLEVRDARLPSASPWGGQAASEAQKAFGRSSALTISRGDGTVFRRVASLADGLPMDVVRLTVLPGTYVVRLDMPGGEVWEERVVVVPETPARVVLGGPPSAPAPSPPSAPVPARSR